MVAGADELRAGESDEGVVYRELHLPATRWRFVRTALATIRFARSWRPDIVCCFTTEVSLVAPACLGLRIPVAAYIATPKLVRVSIQGGLRQIRRHSGQAIQRLGTLASPIVMTTSEHTARQASEIWGIPARRIAAVGQGLDEAYLESPSHALERAPDAPLRLLSVGRISLTQKPLDIVAESLAASSVPWAHWTIIGSGEHDGVLRDRIQELGIADRVRMIGFMQPRAIARELQVHDLVLLPSRYESFFLTVYEALACDRMVVTNDVAEVKSALGDSKLLVLAREATAVAYGEALSVAWQRLQAPASTEDGISRRIRLRYSWEAACRRFLDAVQEPVGSESGSVWRSAQ